MIIFRGLADFPEIKDERSGVFYKEAAFIVSTDVAFNLVDLVWFKGFHVIQLSCFVASIFHKTCYRNVSIA